LSLWFLSDEAERNVKRNKTYAEYPSYSNYILNTNCPINPNLIILLSLE